MTQTGRNSRFAWTLAVVGALLLGASQTAPAQVRAGTTFVAIPGDGATKRFPDIAFDQVNNAYLVVTGLQRVEARYVAANGSPLGSSVVLTTTGGPTRVACAPALNKCLVVWLTEPKAVNGLFVGFNNGAVQVLTSPVQLNPGANALLTSNAPGVIYSSVSNEFLVTWTDFSPSPNIKAQRVDSNGAKVGTVIPVAATSLWEGFSSLAYNSVQDEYLVGYYFETSAGASSVGAQRVKPGTGALIGGRSTLYSGGFNGTPSSLTTQPRTSTSRSPGVSVADRGCSRDGLPMEAPSRLALPRSRWSQGRR